MIFKLNTDLILIGIQQVTKKISPKGNDKHQVNLKMDL